MKVEIKVPAVGESISEATIGDWLKKNGEFVKRDEPVLALDTDKASVEVAAPADGVLLVQAKSGDVVKIGAIVAVVDTEGVATAGMPQPDKNKEPGQAASLSAAGSPAGSARDSVGSPPSAVPRSELQAHLSPAVRRVVQESGVDPAAVMGTGKGGRLVKSDVEQAARTQGPLGAVAAGGPGIGTGYVAPAKPATSAELPPLPRARGVGERQGQLVRRPMSNIRKRIAERLVQAQQTAAILTTFNEVDMSAILEIREKYKDSFKKKYEVSLGFMGFFVKACIEALKEMPMVNSSIEGTDILEKNFYNIGVAVGTEKGLVVPVLRDVDQLSIAEIELAIKHYAIKAREGRLTVDDLSGGTFTISNGGVYGSLMSTPILNPPQSAILGMHKIQERPVVIAKQIVVRPMMYLALSYDHRIIDGKEAVTFLVKVKECLEDPTRVLLEI